MRLKPHRLKGLALNTITVNSRALGVGDFRVVHEIWRGSWRMNAVDFFVYYQLKSGI